MDYTELLLAAENLITRRIAELSTSFEQRLLATLPEQTPAGYSVDYSRPEEPVISRSPIPFPFEIVVDSDAVGTPIYVRHGAFILHNDSGTRQFVSTDGGAESAHTLYTCDTYGIGDVDIYARLDLTDPDNPVASIGTSALADDPQKMSVRIGKINTAGGVEQYINNHLVVDWSALIQDSDYSWRLTRIVETTTAAITTGAVYWAGSALTIASFPSLATLDFTTNTHFSIEVDWSTTGTGSYTPTLTWNAAIGGFPAAAGTKSYIPIYEFSTAADFSTLKYHQNNDIILEAVFGGALEYYGTGLLQPYDWYDPKIATASWDDVGTTGGGKLSVLMRNSESGVILGYYKLGTDFYAVTDNISLDKTSSPSFKLQIHNWDSPGATADPDGANDFFIFRDADDTTLKYTTAQKIVSAGLPLDGISVDFNSEGKVQQYGWKSPTVLAGYEVDSAADHLMIRDVDDDSGTIKQKYITVENLLGLSKHTNNDFSGSTAGAAGQNSDHSAAYAKLGSTANNSPVGGVWFQTIGRGANNGGTKDDPTFSDSIAINLMENKLLDLTGAEDEPGWYAQTAFYATKLGLHDGAYVPDTNNSWTASDFISTSSASAKILPETSNAIDLSLGLDTNRWLNANIYARNFTIEAEGIVTGSGANITFNGQGGKFLGLGDSSNPWENIYYNGNAGLDSYGHTKGGFTDETAFEEAIEAKVNNILAGHGLI